MAELGTADTATENSQTAAKKRPDYLGIALVGLVTINLVTVGALGFYLDKLWGQYHVLAQETDSLKRAQIQESEAPREPSSRPPEIGILYPIESFLVNIASDQGPKFLQTQLEFELTDPDIEEEIARKKPAIRDAIIVLLSSRTYAELRNANGLKKLRTDLLRTVNNILTSGSVKALYFTQFHFN